MKEIKKAGVVIADDYEYEPFVRWCSAFPHTEGRTGGRDHISVQAPNGMTVTAIKCGIGKVNAAHAAAMLRYAFGCDAIFNIGLSGAISGLRKNEIIAGSSFVECDFDLTPLGRRPGEKPGQDYIYEADAALLEASGLRAVPFGSGDFFLADKAKAAFYRETFGVLAFDMESAAIASVCAAEGIPFLSVRSISDNADDVSPDSYNTENNKKEVSLTETLFDVLYSISPIKS